MADNLFSRPNRSSQSGNNLYTNTGTSTKPVVDSSSVKPVIDSSSTKPVIDSETKSTDKKPTVVKKITIQSNEPKSCSVKDIPADVINAIKQKFPCVHSNRDAIIAMAVVFLGVNVPMSDSLKQAIENYHKNDMVSNLSDRIANLDKRTSTLVDINRELELAIAFILFERLGYRRNRQSHIGNIDLLEDNQHGSVEDMIDRMRSQAKEFKKNENIKRGREKGGSLW